MPRFYSERFLLEVHQLDSERLGVSLAKACISNNLPAMQVAKAMGVSRMTIHSWFRGKPLRDKNATLAKEFIKLISEGVDTGALPAQKLSQARDFIEKSIVRLR
jgi:cysteine sulfinate desulfinase/cysteine desulfurase-like protein